MKRFLTNLVTPVLLACYPVVFLYNNNADILQFTSIFIPIIGVLFIAINIYTLFFFITKQKPASSGIAALVFLLFFYTYGILFGFLLKIDIVQAEHATLLPVFFYFGIMAAYFATKIKANISTRLLQAVNIILGGLLLINTAGIVTQELSKIQNVQAAQTNLVQATDGTAQTKRPDVYFIILDESVGFDAIREYWNYTKVDEFEDFLTNKGFFIANDSRSKTYNTLIEMSSRLNYEDWSTKEVESAQDYFQAISNNKVMKRFKQLGYTTVVLDQVRAENGYITKPPIQADFNFSSSEDTASQSLSFDQFSQLVFNNTMLRPVFESLKQADPAIIQHRKDVLYFFDKIGSLEEVPSPKFIYGHVLLTHVPTIFDPNGNMLDSKYFYDWNYYLDSYIFEINKVTGLITTIMERSDPDNLPIIIIQSDHGFRNILSGNAGSVTLKDYPEKYKYSIINAMYLPGFDTSKLAEDLDPNDTFPIIFNYYFNDNIPLQ